MTEKAAPLAIGIKVDDETETYGESLTPQPQTKPVDGPTAAALKLEPLLCRLKENLSKRAKSRLYTCMVPTRLPRMKPTRWVPFNLPSLQIFMAMMFASKV
jgi:hypothetical protein